MQWGRIELHPSLLRQDVANLDCLLTPFKICDIRQRLNLNQQELLLIQIKTSLNKPLFTTREKQIIQGR